MKLKSPLKLVGMILMLLALFACEGKKDAGQNILLEVLARQDGKPVELALVSVDGQEVGQTDANGIFSQVIQKQVGAEVQLSVNKNVPGAETAQWTNVFVVKLPKEGQVDKYSFTAELKAAAEAKSAQSVSVVVTDQGVPVADATVMVGGKEVGKTDANGTLTYEYDEATAKESQTVTVTKEGATTWKQTTALEPGKQIEATLAQKTVLTVSCLTDEYGRSKPVQGVVVSLDGQTLGTTAVNGNFSKTFAKASGKKVRVTLEAPGYLPDSLEKTVVLKGVVNIQHYFHPAKPRPIRTGIYPFIGNTPGADLKPVLDQTQDALRAQLFKYGCFIEVPSQNLQAAVKKAKLSLDRLTTKGWQGTSLTGVVDMIVVGSVAQDDKGYLIETKFYTSNGRIVLSQLSRANKIGNIGGVAKEIAAVVIERFPFEGTVVAVQGDEFRINLGKKPYLISRNMEFDVQTPKVDNTGKVTGYREVGSVKVKKVEDLTSLAIVADLNKGEKVSAGDRVIRYVPRDGEDGKERSFFILSVKGGVPPDVTPLSGANIYLNNDWLASTGGDGRTEVPVRVGKNYTMTIYRHGYQQITQPLKIGKIGEVREFALTVNTSLFKVDSQPSGASVFVDDEPFGTTPMSAGKAVTLGFHKVKLSVGESYRDWEEVVEFDEKVEDRTGPNRIVLHKDYLAIAEKALAKGDVDGAIQACKSTEKGHPDYSATHHLLAQLYLDERNDYENAIREFENVLSLPENQQLLYKQYSVAYTNLGHAYYEKGNSMVHKDKDAAAKYFGRAIQNLQVAKQNTRFFPTKQYDEAVHDTNYYTALSYHKLYMLTYNNNVLSSANQAWREYFDFFPKSLEGKGEFEKNRESAQKYWDQIKE